MPAPITLNKKPAEVIPGGLNLVSTTVSLSPGKEEDHEYLHPHGPRVNAR